MRIKDQEKYLQIIIDRTPKPKGRLTFSSIHVVGPSELVNSFEAEFTIGTLIRGAKLLNQEMHVHRLPENVCCLPSQTPTSTSGCAADNGTATPMEEYNAIFEVASSLLVQKADRASLLIYVGWNDIAMDSYAAFIGMLPFRGIQVACITRRSLYGEMLQFRTKSGTFDMDGLTAARMGKFTVHSMFGPNCNSKSFSERVKEWNPIEIASAVTEDYPQAVKIPFKIGGLELPMLTHNGLYEEALRAFANLLESKYPKGYTPIVSVGETCDALGYGQDMLDALEQQDGLLFSHKSGETYKVCMTTNCNITV